VFAFIVGVVVTAAASATVARFTANEEHRLLHVQSAQAESVLTTAIASIEGPLQTAVQLAQATGGASPQFRTYIDGLIGTTKSFSNMTLTDNGRVLFQAGIVPLTDPSSRAFGRIDQEAMSSDKFVVVGLSPGNLQRIGYAVGAPSSRYVLYAERLIPADRVSPVQSNAAFAELNYAIYVGDTTATADVATTDLPVGDLPLKGDTVRQSIPFGTTTLTLVTNARTYLAGQLEADMQWIFLAVGLGISLIVGVLADQLERRRRTAERAASTINELYQQLDQRFDAQREVAETLQRALVPESEEGIPGLITATRYVAGGLGVDVGGDWYGVIDIDGDRFGFAVGDVSGRGVEAAAIMARLRFTLRAYLAEGHTPEDALRMCNGQLDIERDGHFATVLVGVGRVGESKLTIANAGHLNPVLVSKGSARFVETVVGPPIGATDEVAFPTTTVSLEPGDQLIMFTDGLVERRGENIEAGLARLLQAAERPAASLDERVAAILAVDVTEDDIAILALERPRY
jgi:serine phosphatase RsbU (regulator of sigma subunit)